MVHQCPNIMAEPPGYRSFERPRHDPLFETAEIGRQRTKYNRVSGHSIRFAGLADSQFKVTGLYNSDFIIVCHFQTLTLVST
jgi:hypothetical protein